MCLCGLHLAALLGMLLCWHHSRRPVCSLAVTCMQCMRLPASQQLLGVSLVMCGVGLAAWPQGGGSPLDGEQSAALGNAPNFATLPCRTAANSAANQNTRLLLALRPPTTPPACLQASAPSTPEFL